MIMQAVYILPPPPLPLHTDIQSNTVMGGEGKRTNQYGRQPSVAQKNHCMMKF